jgi:hypothetical protein
MVFRVLLPPKDSVTAISALTIPRAVSEITETGRSMRGGRQQASFRVITSFDTPRFLCRNPRKRRMKCKTRRKERSSAPPRESLDEKKEDRVLIEDGGKEFGKANAVGQRPRNVEVITPPMPDVTSRFLGRQIIPRPSWASGRSCRSLCPHVRVHSPPRCFLYFVGVGLCQRMVSWQRNRQALDRAMEPEKV